MHLHIKFENTLTCSEKKNYRLKINIKAINKVTVNNNTKPIFFEIKNLFNNILIDESIGIFENILKSRR